MDITKILLHITPSLVLHLVAMNGASEHDVKSQA